MGFPQRQPTSAAAAATTTTTTTTTTTSTVLLSNNSLQRSPIFAPADRLRSLSISGSFTDTTSAAETSSACQQQVAMGNCGSSRLYRMGANHRFSGTLCVQKLAVMNPLLLMDMALPLLHPASLPRITWDITMLVVTLYVAVVAPLKISFSQATHILTLHVLDLIATACLALDIIVNFRTAFISPRGELVRDSRLIASRYARGMLLLDVAAALPFSIILHLRDRVTAWLALLKLIPLLRLIRLMKGSGYVGSILAMGRLIIFMLLVAHWACCFWHYLSEAIPEWPWMFTVRCPSCSASLQYLMGFYSAFLLLLGDKPDTHNNLERAVVTGLLFMGTLLYAIVVGSMSLLVASMFAMASRHRQRAAMVDDALRYRGVSEDVRDQVGEYFAYLADYQHPGTDGVAFLQDLPIGLYSDFMGTMFGPRLSKVQLFANSEQPFLWRLSKRLRLSLYMPGDVIYDFDTVGHDMYIIWKGVVALVGLDGCMTALLCDGDHFGELGVMAASAPRPHRVVALRPSDVMLLSRWDLQDAMKDFPESAALVKYRARTRVEDHEAPGNHFWAWETILMAQATESAGYDKGIVDGDAGLISGALRRRRQQRQAAAARAARATTAAVVATCRFAAPPGDGDGGGRGSDACGDGSVRPRLRADYLRPGPLAEAVEVAVASTATSSRGSTVPLRSAATTTASNVSTALAAAAAAAAATEVATKTKPESRGMRYMISSFGARLTGFLRSDCSLGGGQAPPGPEENNATAAAAGFCLRDDDDTLSFLAVSSGLLVRAPSSATLQALVRQGPTLTATQRRAMLSSLSPVPTLSGSGAVCGAQPQVQQQESIAASSSIYTEGQSTRAWGSQDDKMPVGVRHSLRTHLTTPSATAGIGGKLSRQLSRQQRNGLWLETMRVEEINDEETATGHESGGVRPSAKRWHLPGEPSYNSGTNSSSHGKQRHAVRHTSALLPTRLSVSMQSQQAALPLGASQACINLTNDVSVASSRSPSSGSPLVNQAQLQLQTLTSVDDMWQHQQEHQLQPLQKQYEAPKLPSLEEVWTHIQKAATAAGSGGQQLAGGGGGGGGGGQKVLLHDNVPASQNDQQQQQHQEQLSPGRYEGQTRPHRSINVLEGGSRCGSNGGRVTADGLQLPPLPLPPAASATSKTSQGPEGSSCGGVRQGSTGATIPKLLSQGLDEGTEMLMVAPSASPPQLQLMAAAFLHTRPTLSPFASFTPPGLRSPMNHSPGSSLTGFFPSASQSRQLAVNRAATAVEPLGSSGSALQLQASPLPGRQISRLLTRATSLGRSHYGNYTITTRGPRSSAGYTVASSPGSGGCGGVRAASDGLLNGGDGSDDGDSGSWSSGSYSGERRRLVASLRSQLAQSNARVLTLEARIADMDRNPLKVPAVAAVVQREISSALTRMGLAMDSRLTELQDLVALMSARVSELSEIIAAADERLHHLECGGNFHSATSNAVVAAANAATAANGSGGVVGGSVGDGGSGRGKKSSSLPLEAILMARHSASGHLMSGGKGSFQSLYMKGTDSTASSRMSSHTFIDSDNIISGHREWYRNLTVNGPMSGGGGNGGGGGGGMSFNSGSRRTAGSNTLQAPPLQGILKSGLSTVAAARMSADDVNDRDPFGGCSSTAVADLWSSLTSMDGSVRQRLALPTILAAANAAAADKETNVRRRRMSLVPPAPVVPTTR